MRLLLILLLATGCADEADGITYEGTPGQPTPANMDALIPSIDIQLNGEARHFLVDTGAPLTIVNAWSFPGRPEGKALDELEACGLTFPEVQTATWGIFDPAIGLEGIIGGDLLRHFAFSIDYRGERIWLGDPFDPATHPADLEVGAEIPVAFDLLGGGLSLLPGCGGDCGTINLPATRVIVPLRVEGQAEPSWGLVDSGASAVVLDETFFAGLGDPARPELTDVTVGTVTGNYDAKLSRVWRASVGEGDAVASLDDVPVLVIPGALLFDNISLEVGRPIVALVGGSMLRRWMTTFDYQEHLLRLAPYASTDHIPANEYVGPGFRLAAMGSEWIVADVYGNTDAAAEGLVELDVVETLGGTAITGASETTVGQLLGQYALGEEIPVGVRTASGTVEYLVLVEDLLPSYPAP